MKGQKDLRTLKKGVSKIENQGKKLSEMLQNGQMTDLGEKLDHLQVLPFSETSIYLWLSELEIVPVIRVARFLTKLEGRGQKWFSFLEKVKHVSP